MGSKPRILVAGGVYPLTLRLGKNRESNRGENTEIGKPGTGTAPIGSLDEPETVMQPAEGG